ncbi:glycosyltransferase family 4 protein [Bosea massiliensis]|uniref:Glycosyltransferase family 4 protein n=1 Tax=Bosea massiliensis TaxID=151419 RepID=A0ABW0P6K7_9HYPH
MARPLRLVIDLRWMIPGTAGGLENVAWCFLERLFSAREFADITLIVPGELVRRLRMIAPAHIRLTSRDSFQWDMSWLLQRIGVRQARDCDRDIFDIAYAMNGRIHPDLMSTPTVVMMADLQHFVLPQLFDLAEQQDRAQASIEAARCARLLLTISDFSRSEIARILKIPSDQVLVAHLAPDAVFERENDRSAEEAIVARYGLSDTPYCLLPAQLWQHKNHSAVISALEIILAQGGDAPLLICTGADSGSFAERLKADTAKSPVAAHVRFLGRVPREDQPALYAGARALVFCSLYEGFGMPVVEAMAMGCPVIAANSSALPEVAGGAAILVSGDDPTAIAAAIRQVSTDDALRARLIVEGLRRVAQFSWQRHFEDVIAALWRADGRGTPDLQMRSTVPGKFSLPVLGTSLSARLSESIYPKLRRELLMHIRRLRKSFYGARDRG